jgi:hypothetical protein
MVIVRQIRELVVVGPRGGAEIAALAKLVPTRDASA